MIIILTNEEQDIWDFARDKNLEDVTSEEQKIEILLSYEKLIKSLLERKAIPEVRLDYFTKPEYNLHNPNRSRWDSFKNLEKPSQHPPFYKHLKYFIEGPCIPNQLLNTINQIRAKHPYYPSDSLDEVKNTVRIYLKSNPEEKQNLAKELYKLYIELDDSNADILRKYTMNLKL